LCKKKVYTIFPPSITHQKKKKYLIKKNTNILIISRLSFEKNIIVLVKSLNEIKNKEINLTIIGEGDQKNKILNIINNYGLSDRIKLLGKKIKVDKYLMESDLFINCSFFEGFPNAVVEAINYNLPVIASHSGGGIYDIIKYGRKVSLFNSKDFKELSKKVIFFHKNKKLFLKYIKKNKINSKNFFFKNSIRKYEKLFRYEFKKIN